MKKYRINILILKALALVSEKIFLISKQIFIFQLISIFSVKNLKILNHYNIC
jgi:hypothetical protein